MGIEAYNVKDCGRKPGGNGETAKPGPIARDKRQILIPSPISLRRGSHVWARMLEAIQSLQNFSRLLDDRYLLVDFPVFSNRDGDAELLEWP